MCKIDLDQRYEHEESLNVHLKMQVLLKMNIFYSEIILHNTFKRVGLAEHIWSVPC
jgi:hypothetical protein